MARCSRCDGCTNQWDEAEGKPCPHCNYPSLDSRVWWWRWLDALAGFLTFDWISDVIDNISFDDWDFD